MSADEISAYANLRRLTVQREEFRKVNWKTLAENHGKSVFYQLDLQQAAEEYSRLGLELPAELDETTPLLTRISDAMFRARTMQLKGEAPEIVKPVEDRAFALMRNGLVSTVDFR
ncbi:bifunctional fucokinase/L-fucose-1-P-guanylyltransferase, partial [Phocaeicola sp. HCN-40430]